MATNDMNSTKAPAKGQPQFICITGSPAAGGIALLDNAGKLRCVDNPSQAYQWNTASPAVTDGTGDAMMMCGSNTNGIAVMGAKLRYLSSLGNSQAIWKDVTEPGEAAQIDAITGDNSTGFAVLDKSQNRIWQLLALDGKSEWKVLPVPPFQVSMLAGDNKNGLVIVGGDGADVAHTNAGDCTCWTAMRVPFTVKQITGNAASGFVLHGEGQLSSIDAKWNVTALPRPNFKIRQMSGNAKDGLVALLGQGDVVAYCSDLTKAQWMISTIVQE